MNELDLRTGEIVQHPAIQPLRVQDVPPVAAVGGAVERPSNSAPSVQVRVVVDNIRTIRKANGWTQTDLAERCERFGRVAISKIENGKRGISVLDLEDLGSALGVEPWRLLRPLNVTALVMDGRKAVSGP